MVIPLKYNLRNLFVRWRATLATILGVGMVVFVYIWLQALAAGLEKASGTTGDPRNLIVVRLGSDSESSSQISPEDYNLLKYHEEIARDENGQPLVSADTIVVANIPRVGTDGGANVMFRGVSPRSVQLRPQVTLVGGRWFEAGNREITVSTRIAGRFADMQIGGILKIGAKELKVVGHFDAKGSAFDSEAWMDANEARALFNRSNYSSVLVRPKDAASIPILKARLEDDKRLAVRARSEVEYYSEQTKTATPIRYLGNLLAVAMSIGAVFAAMNTMYASVGARTREIGTLRVLGFPRGAVVFGILLEGAALAMVGGLLGIMFGLLANGYQTGTFNFQTFSESVFEIKVTPLIALKGLVFSAIVGVLGSMLPALRASRMPLIAALKAI